MSSKYGYIGYGPDTSPVIVAKQVFSPTGVQTNFTFAAGYQIGYLDVYLNGARQIEGQDFSATDTSTVGLSSAALNGDVLELVAYKAYNLAAPSSVGSFSVGGNLVVSGNESVSTLVATTAIGIGTANPTKPLHIYTADGDIRIGDITDGTGSTDAGIIFTGLGTVTSALFTEANGQILSYAINSEQIIGIQTARAGGVFRLDSRTSGSLGDANCFVVKARPIGTSTEYNALVVGLNDGNTYLSPITGNVGIGTTNPTSKLTVGGNVNVTGNLNVTGSIPKAVAFSIALGM
jgi:hypothetical protein